MHLNSGHKKLWEKALSVYKNSVFSESIEGKVENIVKSFGVLPSFAKKCVEISPKFCKWIAYSALKEDRLNAEEFLEEHKGDYRNIVKMLSTENKPKTNIKDLDYQGAMKCVSDLSDLYEWVSGKDVENIDFKKHTWEEAVERMERMKSGGFEAPGKILHKFGDGFYFIELDSNFCDKESEYLGHCGIASSPDMKLISLRKNTVPCVTIDWHPSRKYVIQIRGKQNTKPVEKYHKYISWLLGNGDLVNEHRTYDLDVNNNLTLKDMSPELVKKTLSSNPYLKFDLNIFDEDSIDKVPHFAIDNFTMPLVKGSNYIKPFIIKRVSPQIFNEYVKKMSVKGQNLTKDVIEKIEDDELKRFYLDKNSKLSYKPLPYEVLSLFDQRDIDSYIQSVGVKGKLLDDEVLGLASSDEIRTKYWEDSIKKSIDWGVGVFYNNFIKTSPEFQREYREKIFGGHFEDAKKNDPSKVRSYMFGKIYKSPHHDVLGDLAESIRKEVEEKLISEYNDEISNMISENKLKLEDINNKIDLK